MPPNHLILCRPLLLLPSIFPSIRVFSSNSVLRIRWLQSWSLIISPSMGVISFRMDWFDLLAAWSFSTLEEMLLAPKRGPPGFASGFSSRRKAPTSWMGDCTWRDPQNLGSVLTPADTVGHPLQSAHPGATPVGRKAQRRLPPIVTGNFSVMHLGCAHFSPHANSEKCFSSGDRQPQQILKSKWIPWSRPQPPKDKRPD